MAVGCALAAGGCANFQLPRIDPSGERVFLWPGEPPPVQPPLGAPVTTGPVGPAQGGIAINPSQVVAPVGSEVVMIASVFANPNFLLSNQRVEWMLAPDGVGEFLSPGVRRFSDVVSLVRGLPKKVDSRYVINDTLFSAMTLDRGTPTPLDDILIQGGQSWVSVTSPTEGTSRVTVFCPRVFGWDRRQQTASIYWVDAQWRFPPPAITSLGGRNTLTTTVSRQSDNSPLAGWQVRYEIAGGPDAALGAEGATSAQVATNEAGEASVEVFQNQPTAGTNQVTIQVIRPAGLGGQNQPVNVGSGSTLQTWGASVPTAAAAGTVGPPPAALPQSGTPPRWSPPGGAASAGGPPAVAPPAVARSQAPLASAAQLDVSVRGPSTAAVGSSVQVEVQVINRGTAPATKLLVTDRFDAGLQHAASASPIERDLIDLQPGASTRLAVTFRVVEPGEQCQDIEVTGEGGARATARHCLTATVASADPSSAPGSSAPTPSPAPAGDRATLSVRQTGPDRKTVGETARFTIQVTNSSGQAVDDLVISDTFETSLEPVSATDGKEWMPGNAIGWRIGTLDAGQSVRREVEFKCAHETPRACSRVNVTAKNMQPLSDEACVEIVGASCARAPAAEGANPINVSVAETTDPVRVGGDTTYQVLVENKGQLSQFDVVVVATLSEELKLDTIAGPVRGSVVPPTVRFPAIKELRANESPLSYELRATAVRAGTAKVRVDVTCRGQTRPVSAEQTTQVLP